MPSDSRTYAKELRDKGQPKPRDLPLQYKGGHLTLTPSRQTLVANVLHYAQALAEEHASIFRRKQALSAELATSLERQQVLSSELTHSKHEQAIAVEISCQLAEDK